MTNEIKLSANKPQVPCCPECKKKINKHMYRKATNDFRCAACEKILKKEELVKREADYFYQIIGYRKIRKRIYTDGKPEVITEELPRIRKGKRPLDDKELSKFDRDTLYNMIRQKYLSAEAIYVKSIKQYKLKKRNAALIAMLYLTGARISELVGMKHESEFIVEPITKEQITQYTKNNELIFRIANLPVLKHRTDVTYDIESQKDRKIVPRRTIDLIYKYEKEFIDIILDWLKEVKPGEPIFPIGREMARQTCYKFHRKYNHFWRHLRATHMMNDYGFTSLHLKQYFGWASAKMAEKYSHLDTNTLLESMIIGKKKREVEE